MVIVTWTCLSIAWQRSMQKQTNTSIPYVSCLISGLTCHMNQHDLGASLKSPTLLVQTGHCKPPATNNTYFVGAITHAQTGNIFQRIAGSVRTYHVTNSDANCLTVAVFFRTKHPLLSPNEAPTPESNPIRRYQSERRQSKMSKFPGIVLNNPTNVN